MRNFLIGDVLTELERR